MSWSVAQQPPEKRSTPFAFHAPGCALGESAMEMYLLVVTTSMIAKLPPSVPVGRKTEMKGKPCPRQPHSSGLGTDGLLTSDACARCNVGLTGGSSSLSLRTDVQSRSVAVRAWLMVQESARVHRGVNGADVDMPARPQDRASGKTEKREAREDEYDVVYASDAANNSIPSPRRRCELLDSTLLAARRPDGVSG